MRGVCARGQVGRKLLGEEGARIVHHGVLKLIQTKRGMRKGAPLATFPALRLKDTPAANVRK